MPQIVPIHLELAMIVHMNEFMHDRVLHMLFMHYALLAESHSASIWRKATGAHGTTRGTDNVLWLHVAASSSEVFKHKCHAGAYSCLI